MQLALSEPALTGAPLTGTWSATFKNGDSFSGSAVAGLAANGYLIILNIQAQLLPCGTAPGGGGAALIGFSLINVVVTSSKLTAVSERVSCSGAPLVGTVTLSKQ